MHGFKFAKKTTHTFQHQISQNINFAAVLTPKTDLKKKNISLVARQLLLKGSVVFI